MSTFNIPLPDYHSRAHLLIEDWLRGQVETNIRLRGGDVLPIASAALNFVPYFLATIYYSAKVLGIASTVKKKRDRSAKLAIWLDESIEQILRFAPDPRIMHEECRRDLHQIAAELSQSLDEGHELASMPELLANRFSDVLRRHNLRIGNRERELVDYIVVSEVTRLGLR